MAGLRPREDRIYNPLPLYHANSAVVSLMGAILTGNCQIQPDRFHPQRWWREVAETRATIVHYLGVIAPLLLNQPPGEDERHHKVRFGIGAGIEPQLHAAVRTALWLSADRGLGHDRDGACAGGQPSSRVKSARAPSAEAVPGIEVRVVDDGDRDVADGEPGEMLVRHSAATPRRGFFSGYLKDDAATESVWRGGWFHTGDMVWRGADGMMHFVDRKKNIIRRSGENIAAAEVEAVLLTHPDVQQAAVMAVKDELREEEVFACVVLKRKVPDREAATALFQHCYERLAYYKAPGWIHVVHSLPTTGTQKIQKHSIYPAGTDPRSMPAVVDLRALKRRQPNETRRASTQDRVASRKSLVRSPTGPPIRPHRSYKRLMFLVSSGGGTLGIEAYSHAGPPGPGQVRVVNSIDSLSASCPPYPRKRTFPYCGRAGPICGARTGLAIRKRQSRPGHRSASKAPREECHSRCQRPASCSSPTRHRPG